jgi:hypothetical protein
LLDIAASRIDHNPVWAPLGTLQRTLIIHTTCVDPLQLGIMGRNMTASVTAGWLKLERFLIVTSG